MTKLFACYAIFQETVCDNGLRISLPSHTRHFASGDHLWMFITKLTTLLSSTHSSLPELNLYYRKPPQLVIWISGQCSRQQQQNLTVI